MNKIKLNWILVVTAALTLIACNDSEKPAAAKPAPVHFEHGDECHVCGMMITRFPGPKGQAITEKHQKVLKFCSTRDMFSWVLQPENSNRNHTLYVHNMAQTQWDSPNDTALIDARKAFYVAGSGQTGAMGPTLAAFATRAEADAFAGEHGGEVLAFGKITMDHLTYRYVDE